MIDATRIVELRRLLLARGAGMCRRCRDTGVVSIKHGLTYETDTAEEMELAWHDEKCPQCGGIATQALGLLPELLDALEGK